MVYASFSQHHGNCTILIMRGILHSPVAPSMQSYISTVHHIHGYISSIALWIGAFYHYSLIASVYIGLFCNQHHLNYSDNKLWARIFQTSLCQSLVLSILVTHEFCDECHRHLSSSCTISSYSRYTLLAMLSSSTSIFSSSIASCHFLIGSCFSSNKSLSSESRDEILFRGGGCDSSCTCNTKYILLVWNMYLFV
jgi:hypothetical protein